MRRLISLILALLIIVNVSLLGVLTAFAHEASLDVEYDDCFDSENAMSEMWYALVYPGKECYHISHEVQTIKYYFADNPESGYRWEDVPENMGEEIKSSYADSMKKWNNVYFYSYDSAGNVIKNKVINIVEGTLTDNNLIIYPTNDANASRAHTDKEEDSIEIIETTESIDHYHISEWSMTINVEYFYVHGNHDEAEVNNMRDRTGAHEIGHMLGLRDIDEVPCGSYNQSYHHEDLLMGYGSMNVLPSTDITYKDIAGVAITRGFHTDSDHKWLYVGQQSDGTYKLICSICNGVKYVESLSGYTYDTYNACGENHTLSSGNMMAVASYGTSDYYKCKYCRYVAPFENIVAQNYSRTYFTDELHRCTNSVEGLEYSFNERHTFVNNVCTGCGFNHSHSYGSYSYYDRSSHAAFCSCGDFVTEGHYIKRSEIVNNRFAVCLGCGSLLDLTRDFATGTLSAITQVSDNGSYILPSGIVVLVDEDVQVYIEGNLVFYNPNKATQDQ